MKRNDYQHTDFSGMQFGYWTVLKKIEPKYVHGYPRPMYLCKCKCGNIGKVGARELMSGHSKSCGCLSAEMLSKMRYKHGETGTKLYWAYSHMIERCYNKNDKSYYNYGGRGITVCDEWREKPDGINNFFNWAKSSGYDENNKDLSLDRIDVNGNYEPNNCRWVDRYVQANNKRNNIELNVYGHRLTPKQFSREFNYNYQTTLDRVNREWTVEEMLAIDPTVYFWIGVGNGEDARQRYIKENNIEIPKVIISPLYDIKTGKRLGKLDKYPLY